MAWYTDFSKYLISKLWFSTPRFHTRLMLFILMMIEHKLCDSLCGIMKLSSLIILIEKRRRDFKKDRKLRDNGLLYYRPMIHHYDGK